MAARIARAVQAGIAQLVEHKLPKLGVAGSKPVARSRGTLLEVRPGSLFEVVVRAWEMDDLLQIVDVGLAFFVVL